MGLYYVFDTKAVALSADAYISQIGGAPIVGVNAKTGQPEPNKAKTERWAIPQKRLDEKWIFPVVPDEISSQYPPEVAQAFNTNFPNTREEYDPNWFPVEE